MQEIHTKTEHSYQSVRKNAFFLDWQTQPQNHKRYPKFAQRISTDGLNGFDSLELIGGVSYQKKYPTGMHSLRTNPSAGGLYPCEIYLQIRGVEGVLSGIYHYEPYQKSLCLLQEIDGDGIEHYFKHSSKQNGIIFLISAIYFRSSWKYRNRSIRYILLDSGHQLGAVYAWLCTVGKEARLVFDFNKLSLNETFGFRDDEMFTCAISSTTSSDKSTKKLRQNIPYSCGCDYLETNSFIQKSYKQTAIYESQDIENLSFFNGIAKDILKEATVKRRSIRAFRQVPITTEEFHFIIKDIFDFASEYGVEIFYTVHRVEGLKQGLYLKNSCIKDGDFSAVSKYLSLEQNLGGQSAVTFYFTASGALAYQKVNILSGFLAHIIYLKSTIKSIGCSGIGAYYDKETKDFLETNNNILYLLAIGR